MYDIEGSSQCSGREELGCIISQVRPVVSGSFWKTAIGDCLCAVSQSLFVLWKALPRLLPWKPAVGAVPKLLTLFWGGGDDNGTSVCQNEWVQMEENYGGGGGGEERRIYCGETLPRPPPLRWASLCLGSPRHALQLQLEGRLRFLGNVTDIRTDTVTVWWVCPSCLEHSHHIPPLTPTPRILTGSILHHHHQSCNVGTESAEQKLWEVSFKPFKDQHVVFVDNRVTVGQFVTEEWQVVSAVDRKFNYSSVPLLSVAQIKKNWKLKRICLASLAPVGSRPLLLEPLVQRQMQPDDPKW